MKFLKVIYFNKFINRLNQNLKIQQKTYLAFLFVSVIIFGISSYAIYSTNHLNNREKEILALSEISENFTELNTIVIKAENYIHSNNIAGFLELEKKFESIADTLTVLDRSLKIELVEIEDLIHVDLLHFSTEIKRAANEYFQYARLHVGENLFLAENTSYNTVISSLKDFNSSIMAKKRTIDSSLSELIASEKREFKEIKITILILLLIGLFMCIIIANYVSYRITAPIKKLTDNIVVLSKGNYNLDNEFEVLDKDEIGEISNGIEAIGKTLEETVHFTEKVGNNDFAAELNIDKTGSLAKALNQMRDKLLSVTQINEQKRIEEEKRNWIIQGLTMFNDILRLNQDNIEKLHYEIIKNLITYIDANQGGLFIIEEYDDSKILELKAMFAYNRQKFLQKEIELGVGLIGQVALEKKTRYLTEIPESYLEIGSGLGGASPKNLIIIPLKLNDEIFGIVEIASFNEIEEHKQEFLEKAAENIASSISGLQINLRTQELLEKSQQQAEEMAAQEEEMRQNMEELQATQEESDRRNQQVQELLDESGKRESEIKALLEEAYDNQAVFQQKLEDANELIKKLKKGN